ncbi:MAG: hypothetical protein IJ695_07630 [Butyrivibrio sp.]|nr:hypothetical protein [Butyrivibrio sp.]
MIQKDLCSGISELLKYVNMFYAAAGKDETGIYHRNGPFGAGGVAMKGKPDNNNQVKK